MKKYCPLFIAIFLAIFFIRPVFAQATPDKDPPVGSNYRRVSPSPAPSLTPVDDDENMPADSSTTTPTQNQRYEAFLQNLNSRAKVGIPKIMAAENLVVTEDIDGDLYAFGNNVQIDGDVNGDLIAAGASVMINGNVSDDVRVAAATVIINGEVGKNVTVGAGELVFDQNSVVNGSVIAGAGNTTFAGQILGKVWLGGQDANLTGNFGHDFETSVEELSVNSNVMVAGNFKAKVDSEFSSEDSLIKQDQVGGKREITRRVSETSEAKQVQPEQDKMGRALAMAMITKFLLKVATGMVMGSLALYFFPKVSEKLSAFLLGNPLASVGYGFAALVLTPMAVVLMMVLVVTLPLGFFTLMFYMMMLVAAKWVSARTLGVWLAKMMKVAWLKNKYAQLALGLVVLFALSAVPVLGWAVKTIAFFLGMGALVNLVMEVFGKKVKV